MQGSPIINLHNVNFYYGQVRALTDINMDFFKNNVTALIGPSGCGKSTFLRTLNRMNDLIPNVRTTGEVLIDDFNIYNKEVDVVNLRKKIGMVFARLKKGLDFGSNDKKAAKLIFFIGTPGSQVAQHVKVLQAIMALIKEKSVRKALLSAEKPSDIVRIIKDNEFSSKEEEE